MLESNLNTAVSSYSLHMTMSTCHSVFIIIYFQKPNRQNRAGQVGFNLKFTEHVILEIEDKNVWMTVTAITVFSLKHIYELCMVQPLLFFLCSSLSYTGIINDMSNQSDQGSAFFYIGLHIVLSC